MLFDTAYPKAPTGNGKTKTINVLHNKAKNIYG